MRGGKKPYQRGSHFERCVKKYFERLGYFVGRQAKSAFPDLICLRKGEILLVECKVDGYLPPEDKARFSKILWKSGGRALVASRPKRGEILFAPVR